MLLTELANNGVRLPEIGFGTWNYRGGIQPLRAAIECGARLIDTAESYGTEEIVGEAIKGQRHQVFLATKALPRNFRRRDLIASAERSLRRLGTDMCTGRSVLPNTSSGNTFNEDFSSESCLASKATLPTELLTPTSL